MVSLEDYASGLIRDYLGWFGGDYDRIARTDCLALAIAIEGRYGALDVILTAIFGKKDADEFDLATFDPAKAPPITQGMFSATFGKKK